jgi:death-on-curing protein
VSGREPVWLLRSVVEAIHDEQLAEHGGGDGLRDAGLLDSALARPRNLAAYGYGIARNHAFVDGNKRTAFVAVELFLELNGHALQADDAACVIAMEGVADGSMDEQAFVAWIRSHLA